MIRERPSRDGMPRHYACASLVINGNLAVNQHVRNANREAARVIVRGGVDYVLMVEDDEIGIKSLLDSSTLRQAKPAGSAVGHPVYYPFKADTAKLPAQSA